jgi:hypothetical protein
VISCRKKKKKEKDEKKKWEKAATSSMLCLGLCAVARSRSRRLSVYTPFRPCIVCVCVCVCLYLYFSAQHREIDR